LLQIGVFEEIYARHTESPNVADPGFSQALVTGTNLLSFRDSSNTSPQAPGSIVPVIDTSTSGSGFVTVTITEVDSNLDAAGLDKIFAKMTSTTQPVGLVFQLDEDAVNSAVFVGQVFISTSVEPGKLQVSPGDVLQVFYEPQHLGAARMSATLENAADGDIIQIQDYTIDDPDGFDTRRVQACPYDLVIHPVEILLQPLFPNPIDEITVTFSYANAVGVGPGETYQVSDLELLYRTGTDIGISAFSRIDISSPFVVDTNAKTITGTLLKGEILPILSGQYALGVDIAGCLGGGGGGIVIPVLVVSASAELDLIELGDLVESLNLDHGIENSLLAKVNAAADSFEAGDIDDAIGSLNAFINQVNAQSGKKIDPADAADLIAAALDLIAEIQP